MSGELIQRLFSEIIASKHIKGKKELVNSFINSIIDVDTLDYLLRDSVHCGVNYGEGIDLERLLDSLYINPNTKRLCLTEKGRSALLSILSCRNVMYQEVYWHKTVRACDAMFKRFLYEYIKDYGKEINMIKESFNYSDDQFINKLYRGSRKNKKLNDLISPFAMNKNRLLYKPAYVFYNSNAEEEPTDTKQFFRKVIDMKYEDLVEMGHNLVTSLNDHLGLNIQNLDILIEKTPAREEHEYTKLEGFEIWNTKKKRFEGYPKELEGLNKYLLGNRQAYVFCNPRYYDNLKGLSVEKWGEIFEDT